MQQTLQELELGQSQLLQQPTEQQLPIQKQQLQPNVQIIQPQQLPVELIHQQLPFQSKQPQFQQPHNYPPNQQQPFQSGQPQFQQQRQQQNSQFDFVEFPTQEMHYYTGVSTFYNEYKARAEVNKNGDSIVSFPVRSCDPLPINSFGDVRWFWTSAVKGVGLGNSIEIINPSITNILVVRGKHPLGASRSEIYFGYDSNNPIFRSAHKRVFQGILLHTMTKSRESVAGHYHIFPNEAAYLSSRLKESGYGKQCYFIQKDGNSIEINRDMFNRLSLSGECYWTITENKLKGIKYKTSL